MLARTWVWTAAICVFLAMHAPVRAQEMEKAIKSGDVEAVVKLLKGDQRLARSPISGGILPLQLAINWEQTDVVRALLAHGADPLAKDSHGETALQWAMRSKNTTIQRMVQDAVVKTASPAQTSRAPASTRPSPAPTSRPSPLWTWLTGGKPDRASSAPSSFKYDRHNYQIRNLPRPWSSMNAGALNPAATFAALRADPVMQFIIISEEGDGSMTQEGYTELVIKGFESRFLEARRLDSHQRTIHGMTGMQFTHAYLINGTQHFRISWHLVHNGFAYQLIVLAQSGSRIQCETAADDLFDCFSLIDSSRFAETARPLARQVSDLGFTVQIADGGWRLVNQQETQREAAAFIALRGNSLRLQVMVASLAGCNAELPEVARAMARLTTLRIADDDVFEPIPPHAEAHGVEFSARWDAGSFSGPARARLVRRGELVYLISAMANKQEDVAQLGQVLDYVQLSSQPPANIDPAHLAPPQRSVAGLVLNDLGINRLNSAAPASAIPFFAAARRFNPDDLILLINYLDALSRSDRKSQALVVVSQELDHFKHRPEILLKKAAIELSANDAAAAQKTYAQLFAGGYSNEAQFEVYIDLLVKDHRLDQAIVAAQDYLTRTDTIGSTLILSNLYSLRGNQDQALELLKDRQAKVPVNSELLLAMGGIYQITREFSRTQEVVQSLLGAGNDSAQTYILKGRSELGLKLPRKAKESFETALRKSPGDAVASEWLGHASRMLGEGENTRAAQELPAIELPAACLQPPDAAAIAALSAGHSACNLVSATAIEFEPGKRMATTEYRTIRIFDTHGVEQFKLMKERFDPLYDRIFVNRLTVRDEKGAVLAEGRPGDYYVQDDPEAASSWRYLHIPVPGIRPGCTIELVITRSEDPAPATFTFNEEAFLSGHPATRVVVALKAPPDQVAWHGIHTANPVQADGFLVWSMAPIVWHSEPLQAPAEEYIPYLMIAQRGRTWQTLATEYLKSIEDLLRPDPAAAELARKLTVGAADECQDPAPDTQASEGLFLQGNCLWPPCTHSTGLL